MSAWYKMNPIDWNDGTDDLTLEQEAAYLRICHAIYITERPVRANGFVIAGLLRCGERKATRLLEELVEAGKLVIEDGLIANRRALEEVSTRGRVRVERQSAGSRGGVASARSRANALKDSGPSQAIASDHLKQSRAEETRTDQKMEPIAQQPIAASAAPKDLLGQLLDANGCGTGFREERNIGLMTLAPILGLIKGGFDLERDILAAIRSKPNPSARTWGYFVPQIRDFVAVRDKVAEIARPIAPAEDWTGRLKVWAEDRTWSPAWGPKPGETGCRAPAELLRAA